METNYFYTCEALNKLPYVHVPIKSFQEFKDALERYKDYTGDLIVNTSLLDQVLNGGPFGKSSEYSEHFDPVALFEMVQRGWIGKLMERNVFTDAYFHPQEDRLFLKWNEPTLIILVDHVHPDAKV